MNKPGYFLLVILFLSMISCKEEKKEAALELYQFQGQALGTTYSIQYYSEKDLNFPQSMDSIIELMNNSMSTYTTSSDISKINRGDTSVVVDDHFRSVFEASKDIYKASDGYFDPTVGSLVNAYGFGPEKEIKSLKQDQLDSLNKLVGFDKISLTNENRILKSNTGMYLDFNAIAKGYSIDVIANWLDQNNCKNYLIELGGELHANGRNLNKDEYWTVGIDDPSQTEGQRVIKAAIHLKDKGMATSGNYRKFKEDAATGQKYVHTINPKTGEAEKSNILSATVIAKNCMLADGYATAIMALGMEKAKTMLEEKEDLDTYLIYSDDNGKSKVFMSGNFEEFLLKD